MENEMKATGIVRRIDDLGRVAIPKDIRRLMRINEGDPLELYITDGGGVTFKKYQPYITAEPVISELMDIVKLEMDDVSREAKEGLLSKLQELRAAFKATGDAPSDNQE